MISKVNIYIKCISFKYDILYMCVFIYIYIYIYIYIHIPIDVLCQKQGSVFVKGWFSFEFKVHTSKD
jgi:hypothetical protein